MTKLLDYTLRPRYSRLEALSMILVVPLYSWIGLWTFAVMVAAFTVTVLAERK